MKIIPPSSRTVTVGTKTWAAIVRESYAEPTAPADAKTLEEIGEELKQAGLPYGKNTVPKYVQDAVKKGIATEHRVFRNDHWIKVYSTKVKK